MVGSSLSRECTASINSVSKLVKVDAKVSQWKKTVILGGGFEVN